MSITVGTQLGAYEITARLGKGGMGEVFRARDKKLKRDVAIKVLPDDNGIVVLVDSGKISADRFGTRSSRLRPTPLNNFQNTQTRPLLDSTVIECHPPFAV